MANAKEIRSQIKSIQNTKKITNAMQMVAASKMRRAQEVMLENRPYAEKIKSVAAAIAKANKVFNHPFLITREEKNVGYIVITSDRGLCGGLNINLFKTLIKDMKSKDDEGCSISLSIFGGKGYKYLSSLGANVIAHKEHLGDRPSVSDLIGPVKVMIDSYIAGDIDHIYLVGNDFINTMVQKPTIEQLLPIPDGFATAEQDYPWDYDYESDPVELLKTILIRYLEAVIKKAVAENIACEMAARMIAMKSATDNASNIISEKQLEYNKARQAAITQELSEIVAGAAAV